MPLPAIPAIAAILARVGPIVARVVAAGRSVVAAAPAVARNVFTGTGMANAGRAAAASRPAQAATLSASKPVQAVVNVNPPAAKPRWRGTPSAPATTTAATPASSQAAAAANTQASQQAGFQTAGRQAQQAGSRWMQRGSQLYQQLRHDDKREQQRDAIEFNRNLSAGMEALKNYDPKALAFWGKAAGLALKGMASLLAGPVGVTAMLLMLPKAMRDFGDSLLEARRPLAEINGSQAITFAKLDRERLGRNMQFARGTAGSTGDLAKAISSLETKLLPLATMAVNLLNKIATAGATAAETGITIAGYASKIDPRLGLIYTLLEWWLKEDEEAAASGHLAEFMLKSQERLLEPLNRKKK